jgi:hypothetical protein
VPPVASCTRRASHSKSPPTPPGITEHEVATAALLDEPPQVAITRQVISGSDDHDPHSPPIDGAPTLGVDRDRPISRAEIGRYSSALQAVLVEVTHELTDGLEAWVVAVVPRHEYHNGQEQPSEHHPAPPDPPPGHAASTSIRPHKNVVRIGLLIDVTGPFRWN